MSVVGLNRVAAGATRTTPLRRATSIWVFAVIPGFNFRSGFATLMIVLYVVTFWTTVGCRRTCATLPVSASSMLALTRILVRSAAIANSVGDCRLAATV